MKAVGVKQLKNQLSRYLKLVQEGEIVYVTDRDEIIAEIHKPVSAPTRFLSRWEAFLNCEERRGAITRAAHAESRLGPLLDAMEDSIELPNWKAVFAETRNDR